MHPSQTTSKRTIKKLFTFKRVVIPILLGLSVTLFMLWNNTNWEVFESLNFGYQSFFWMLIALVLMGVRDLAYMYRVRVLTDQKISWRNCFDVIMLWEFASAITPSVVGGSGVALFILNKEGVNAGKSTAIVMITALLDELFYVITVPLIIVFIGTNELFPIALQKQILGITFSSKGIFVLGYGVILFLTLTILYAVLLNPKGFKAFLLKVFKFRLIKRWRPKVIQLGDDIVLTSKELKDKPMAFWLKAFGATIFSWTARFWVVNFLILAFTSVDSHFLIYGRQLVMWVIMLISPTPGGVGVAEFAFDGFLKDFIPYGLTGVLVVLWRIYSYYPYLIIGAFVLPKWLKRVYNN